MHKPMPQYNSLLLAVHMFDRQFSHIGEDPGFQLKPVRHDLLRHKHDKPSSRLVMWRFTGGGGSPIRCSMRTWVDQMEDDSRLPAAELARLANDRQHLGSVFV